MTAQKILYIDYQKVYQHLTSDRDEVNEEFIAFLERLIERDLKIIASIEHDGITQYIDLSIDDSGKIKEVKIKQPNL